MVGSSTPLINGRQRFGTFLAIHCPQGWARAKAAKTASVSQVVLADLEDVMLGSSLRFGRTEWIEEPSGLV